MIRMIQSSSAAHAKAYFRDALARSDYYLDDQELEGKIAGKLANRIGISGIVTKDIFFDLCDNIHPVTGEILTPRTKDERTVGYDINFHCPKSVSILHFLSRDEHILDAFEKSVHQTMQDIEKDSKTRVRINHQNQERETGELVWIEFTHQTARPVDGSLPDPHLHAHCFTFNATWDETEQRIKACQFRDIKRDMPYYQARFHKRLSDELIRLGYEVQPTATAFEVNGVPQEVIDLFSKRTNEIGRIAKEKGITDIDELGDLGAKTRSRKQKGHSMEELKVEWKKQIHDLETSQGQTGNPIVRYAPEREKKLITPEICIDYALEHCFERASVYQDRRLLATAYRFGIGHQEVSLDPITDNFAQDSRLIHIEEKGKVKTTTKEVLAEEQKMVSLAKQGKGQFRPLYNQVPETNLEGQQKAAIEHVLTTTNRVSIVTGKAGAGKTTTLQSLIPLIEKTGLEVTIVAPSAEASRGVLRHEGFQQAETVAKLFGDKAMQEKLLDQVLIVDEAGLLGTKDMSALLKLSQDQNTRLILMGDTRQHSSVERGDALRILNTVGGIKTAEISKIYRQRHENYRRVVEDLSIGHVAGAFEKLDEMDAIRTIDPMQPYDELVRDYIETTKQKKTALVVSPTRQQSDEVTAAIRQKLKNSGLLGKRELEVSRLQSLNLTDAQKSDWRNFKEGQVIQFNQNLKNINRGSLWAVSQSSENGVLLKNERDELVPLPTDRSKDYDLYEKSMITLAKGDIIRITRNGFDQQKNRLNNQQMLEVTSVTKEGMIYLKNPLSKAEYELAKDFGHLTHGYCITSHSSQGKTVDEVLIAQPASTFPATDSKQFYVSVSRGRDRARIYTDDKEQLMAYASQVGDRQSAIELVQKKAQDTTIIDQYIRQKMNKENAQNRPKTKEDKLIKNLKSKDKDYEPGI